MKYVRKNWLTYLTGFDFKEVVRILDEKASQKWEAFEVLTYLRAILNFFFKVSCKVGPSVRTSFHTSSNADESNVVRRFADATNTFRAIFATRLWLLTNSLNNFINLLHEFFHEFFSHWAIEKENKLFICSNRCFFSVDKKIMINTVFP